PNRDLNPHAVERTVHAVHESLAQSGADLRLLDEAIWEVGGLLRSGTTANKFVALRLLERLAPFLGASIHLDTITGCAVDLVQHEYDNLQISIGLQVLGLCARAGSELPPEALKKLAECTSNGKESSRTLEGKVEQSAAVMALLRCIEAGVPVPHFQGLTGGLMLASTLLPAEGMGLGEADDDSAAAESLLLTLLPLVASELPARISRAIFEYVGAAVVRASSVSVPVDQLLQLLFQCLEHEDEQVLALGQHLCVELLQGGGTGAQTSGNAMLGLLAKGPLTIGRQRLVSLLKVLAAAPLEETRLAEAAAAVSFALLQTQADHDTVAAALALYAVALPQRGPERKDTVAALAAGRKLLLSGQLKQGQCRELLGALRGCCCKSLAAHADLACWVLRQMSSQKDSGERTLHERRLLASSLSHCSIAYDGVLWGGDGLTAAGTAAVDLLKEMAGQQTPEASASWMALAMALMRSAQSCPTAQAPVAAVVTQTMHEGCCKSPWKAYVLGREAAVLGHFAVTDAAVASAKAYASSELSWAWLDLLSNVCCAEIEHSSPGGGKPSAACMHLTIAMERLNMIAAMECRGDASQLEFQWGYLKARSSLMQLIGTCRRMCRELLLSNASSFTGSSRNAARVQGLPTAFHRVAALFRSLRSRCPGYASSTYDPLNAAAAACAVLGLAAKKLLANPARLASTGNGAQSQQQASGASGSGGGAIKTSTPASLNWQRKAPAYRRGQLPLLKATAELARLLQQLNWRGLGGMNTLPHNVLAFSNVLGTIAEAPFPLPRRFFSALPLPSLALTASMAVGAGRDGDGLFGMAAPDLVDLNLRGCITCLHAGVKLKEVTLTVSLGELGEGEQEKDEGEQQPKKRSPQKVVCRTKLIKDLCFRTTCSVPAGWVETENAPVVVTAVASDTTRRRWFVGTCSPTIKI
ncbi:unnamed protein product, partial [Chrysoparadoxa australica]